jgi:antitoxin component of MazEF toxin-antitoxin module
MTTLAVRFSSESVITLPAELARRAGLEESGPVEVTLTAKGLLLTPATGAQSWRVLEERLRYQAANLELATSDERDDAYWQIVEPMLQDLEREVTA